VQLVFLTNCFLCVNAFCVIFCVRASKVIFLSFFSLFAHFNKMKKDKARKAFAILYIISVSLILPNV